MGVATYKLKNDAPIPANIDGSQACAITFELVQSPAGQVHVVNDRRGMESLQSLFQTTHMSALNSSGASRGEEPFQSLVLEALDHDAILADCLLMCNSEYCCS